MYPLKKLVVFAEFAGTYLWLKPANDRTTKPGGNIGDAHGGIPSEYGVSPSLQADFGSWIVKWETTVSPRVEYEEIAPAAFWDEIDKEGLALTKRLKAEVGDRYEVEYHPPWEDPKRGGRDGLITQVMSDGCLQTYRPIE